MECSPYLLRALRSYDQALEDHLERLLTLEGFVLNNLVPVLENRHDPYKDRR